MSQINSNTKDDFQVVLLLSCFVGHPVCSSHRNINNNVIFVGFCVYSTLVLHCSQRSRELWKLCILRLHRLWKVANPWTLDLHHKVDILDWSLERFHFKTTMSFLDLQFKMSIWQNPGISLLEGLHIVVYSVLRVQNILHNVKCTRT